MRVEGCFALKSSPEGEDLDGGAFDLVIILSGRGF
jgi:hypothetical protein